MLLMLCTLHLVVPRQESRNMDLFVYIPSKIIYTPNYALFNSNHYILKTPAVQLQARC